MMLARILPGLSAAGGEFGGATALLAEQEPRGAVSTPVRQPAAADRLHQPNRLAQSGKNTSVRNSMLSRGGFSTGVVGSSNEVCGMNRARPSRAES